MDLTSVTTAITGVQTDIETIAAAIIIVAAAVMAFRWVKAMFF